MQQATAHQLLLAAQQLVTISTMFYTAMHLILFCSVATLDHAILPSELLSIQASSPKPSYVGHGPTDHFYADSYDDADADDDVDS